MHSMTVWHGLLFAGDYYGNIRAFDVTGRLVLLIPRGLKEHETEEKNENEQIPQQQIGIRTTFTGHKDTVPALVIWKGSLWSSSKDYLIKQWKWKD